MGWTLFSPSVTDVTMHDTCTLPKRAWTALVIIEPRSGNMPCAGKVDMQTTGTFPQLTTRPGKKGGKKR